MTEELFWKFAHYIEAVTGMKFPWSKKGLLEGRLVRRLRQLKYSTIEGYYEYLMSDEGQAVELSSFIDAVSTHETFFFREAGHFTFLGEEVLPKFTRSKSSEPFRILSAGCSTGEEAYTLAMVVDAYIRRSGADWDFEIECMDLSERVVHEIARAIYPKERCDLIPIGFVERYMMRSKSQGEALLRVVTELRSKVKGHTGNLTANLQLSHWSYDVIFCRNTLIYFSAEEQFSIVEKLKGSLKRPGYFFVGHAESLIAHDHKLHQVAPAVFRN